MDNKAVVVIVSFMALVLSGCATSKMNKLETDIINRTERLSYDIRTLNEEVDSLKASDAPSEADTSRLEAVEGEQAQVKGDIDQLRDKLATTETELAETKIELAKIKDAMEEKRAVTPPPSPAPRKAVSKTASPAAVQTTSRTEKPVAQPVAQPQTTASSPRIKVLGGDGRTASAREAAGRLEGMGYRVERIDREDSRYSVPVVYYAAGFEGTAKDIAGRLGGGARTKPLTWNSIFDIIVLTEK